MSHGYMVRNPGEVNAWAALGAAIAYDGIKAPVLDLYGADDLPRVLEGAAKRRASLKDKALSKQVVIPGSNHFYADHEEAMVKAVKDFLDSVN
jgi:pimeloyl-ACP methyl ester carboxylesterase